jgi:hypothetical protein
MKVSWYKRKDGIEVFKYGRNKVLEILKKDKEHYNGEYDFYRCLVFNKGEVVAAEGVFGSSLNTLRKAKSWGVQKAIELKIIKSISSKKTLSL